MKTPNNLPKNRDLIIAQPGFKPYHTPKLVLCYKMVNIAVV